VKFHTFLMVLVLFGFILSMILSIKPSLEKVAPCDEGCGPCEICVDDGDGGSCHYQCASNQVCYNGACCTPDSCVGRCGFIDDGCGDEKYCGGCDSDERCVSGYCVCDPYTCSELGVECGTASNGCGGTLNCGDCSDNPDKPYCVNNECVECTSDSHCPEDEEVCSGHDEKATKYYYCDTDNTCQYGLTGFFDCNQFDGRACSETNTLSDLEERDYYCESGECVYTATFIEDCDDRDGIYCNGVLRESRNYFCTYNALEMNGKCDYYVQWDEDCSLYTGYACQDASTKEYRTYTCSGGSCNYTSSNVESCGTDGCYGGEYINHYCSNGNCYSETLDGDDSSTYCSCCSSCKWNIGGEVSATTCCGDDGSEYVCGGVGDNTLDYSYQDPDLDDKACCLSSTDCVYNNVCYPSNSQGPSVDHDSDPDWCGYPGTWRDCNTDAQCGGGTVFGEYEVCRTNDCKVACYNKPCVAGYPECVDEIRGETLYCMNSTSSASQSSHVENPAGGNTNERYCRQDEYYEPGVGCQPKYGEDFCYNYLDPDECGTGNTASVVDCNLIGEYCSFDNGLYKDIVKIESTDAPLQVVGKGPMSPTSTSGECIDTDDGDKPKEWGCVYIMTTEKNNDDDFQIVAGEMGCDYVSDGNLIEFYCSGGEILTKEYTCTILGTGVYTPYCFENPSDSRSITPPTKHLSIHEP